MLLKPTSFSISLTLGSGLGGISGSAAADTASLGSVLIPIMVEQGYDDDFATAITIASSAEGILVPPSHNMVIYATTAGGVFINL